MAERTPIPLRDCGLLRLACVHLILRSIAQSAPADGAMRLGGRGGEAIGRPHGSRRRAPYPRSDRGYAIQRARASSP